MARGPRRESASGIYHVMNRGVDRRPIFLCDTDRLDLGRQLARIHEDQEVGTLAYCLMGNHFHLLLRAPDSTTLSEAMQRLSGAYTQHFNDEHDRDGPLFRGRYRSIPVEEDLYFVWVARYIHRNPVGLPGVLSPADHRWSSYRTYLGLRAAPAFLDIWPLMEMFGGSVPRLAAFTEDDVRTSHRGPGVRPTIDVGVTVDELRTIIECAAAVDGIEHGGEDRARQWLDRTMLVLLVRRIADDHLRAAILEQLRYPSDVARRAAATRAERRLRNDPMVARILAWVVAYLPPPVRAAA